MSNWSRRRLLGAGSVLAAGLAIAPPAFARAGSGGPAIARESAFDVDVGLDPGHSRVDVGASGAGVGEFRHTLDVGLRVHSLLAAQGLRVAITRRDDRPLTPMTNPDPTELIRIEQSARIQAVGQARVYVSIHFNGTGDPRISGTETYYNDDNFGVESLRLAESLQRNVVAAIRGTGYGVSDRGAKRDLLAGKPYGHFFSLRGPMPSALVEGMFLSNPNEAAWLTRDEVRDAIARGYVGGILEYFAAV